MPTSKCFIRYNDNGGKYKVCIDPKNKNAPSKVWDKSKAKSRKDEPGVFKKEKITRDGYLKKLGKSYSELTEGQKRQYMKYNMREVRFKERQKEEKAIKDFKKLKKELKEEKDKEVAKIKEKVEKPKKKASKGGDVNLRADQKISILAKAMNAYRDGFDVDLKGLEKVIGTKNIERFGIKT